MRIAVIADTHDRLPETIRGPLAEADEIWHLGDVCSPAIAISIEKIGPPVFIVRGNCDDCSDWPFVLDIERAGMRIRLTHIPPSDVPEEIDLLLHGHTHVPRDEIIRGVRFLNPGCITRPNRGAPASWAWLEVTPGAPIVWRPVRV
jgi:putative phosphoesterase